MNEQILAIAPHGDDETLGCGGTLLHHKANGDRINWLLVTDIPKGTTMGAAQAEIRDSEIDTIKNLFGFDNVFRMGFTPATLDNVALSDLIAKIGDVITQLKPQILYLPFPGDAHSDHELVFKAAISTAKWFRYESIRSVRLYETLSETNFSLNPSVSPFRPNYYVDISNYIASKLTAADIYTSEIIEHPFPRSKKSIEALATLRGSEIGVNAAEAFMIVKQVEK